MTFETIKFGFGVIVGAAVLWFAIMYLGRFLSWIEQSEIARQKAEAQREAERKKAAAPVAPAIEPGGVPIDHIVVIAAAVAAYGYRVIHIADTQSGHAWAAEGRWQHQTSHRTH
jgi:hypothetical protein